LPVLERVAATEEQDVPRLDAVDAIRSIYSSKGWLRDRVRMETYYRNVGEKSKGFEIWGADSLMPAWDEFMREGTILAPEVRRRVMKEALCTREDNITVAMSMWPALLYFMLDPDENADADMLQLLKSRPDWRVHALVRCCLLRHGRKESLPELAKFLQMTSPPSLPGCGPGGEEWLEARLRDTQVAIAQYLAWQLTGARPPLPIDQISTITSDEDVNAARDFGKFLERYKGTFRYDPRTKCFECVWNAALLGISADAWEAIPYDARQGRIDEEMKRRGREFQAKWERGGFSEKVTALLASPRAAAP
jgi:hypothetical protein